MTFYHVCFVVPDIEQSMADLTSTAGIDWGDVVDDRIGDWTYRMAFSRNGAPYFELIQGPAGSPWDSTLGARCDHIAFWTRSQESSAQRWTDLGFPPEFSGCPFGRPYTYHRIDSLGVRLELMDVSRQERFLAAWDPGGRPMDPFDS